MSVFQQPTKFARLLTLGFTKMREFQKNRMIMLKSYVGKWYGNAAGADGGAVRQPLNPTYHAVTTLVPNLAFNNPKARVDTRWLDYREYAAVLELATNHLVTEIKYRETIRKVITDALFLAGFTKRGLGVSGRYVEDGGFLYDIGKPYAERVDPGDMVLDPTAKDWRQCRFIGNRFTVDRQAALDSGLYDEDQMKALNSRYNDFNNIGTSTLSHGARVFSLMEAGEIMDTVDLVEAWIPEENRVVTYPWGVGNQIIPVELRSVDYSGPSEGPYNMLGFAFVPDNIMPCAPAGVWRDLHLLSNKFAGKWADACERHKKVLAYEGTSWQDAQDIVDAQDGESVRVDNVDAIKDVEFGGPSQETYQYMEWVQQRFSEMAMNSDLLSGTRAAEPTATQSDMLQANSSVRLADLGELVSQFVGDDIRTLAYYLHTDPLIELPMIQRTKGGDKQVVYSPEMRMGEWFDYMIQVKPYSMGRQDPATRTRNLMQFFSQAIPAIAQAYMMLGPAMNLEASLELIGREMGIEELSEIINSPMLTQQMQNMKGLMDKGIPLDQKVITTMMGLQPGIGDFGTQVNAAGPAPVNASNGAAGATPPTPQQSFNSNAQQGAAPLQAAMKGPGGRGSMVGSA